MTCLEGIYHGSAYSLHQPQERLNFLPFLIETFYSLGIINAA